MDITSIEFWIAAGQIILINIILSGDNAVIIALAARNLPPEQRNKASFWGSFGAVALRIILIFFALQLMSVPFLKIVGGLLLLWIGVKLLIPQENNEHNIKGSGDLTSAIRTIVIADVVMSLDNVIAIAAAAKDDLRLVIFGLILSVPLIVYGSRYVMALMDRFPIVIVLGGALLGWIGGGMLIEDVFLQPYISSYGESLHLVAKIMGGVFVVLAGKQLARARQNRS